MLARVGGERARRLAAARALRRRAAAGVPGAGARERARAAPARRADRGSGRARAGGVPRAARRRRRARATSPRCSSPTTPPRCDGSPTASCTSTGRCGLGPAGGGARRASGPAPPPSAATTTRRPWTPTARTTDGRAPRRCSSRRSARASCAARCIAGLALGTAGALLGVFVVQRGLGLVADGLAHATFGGIALGLLLGATPDRAIWVALPFTVAVALGIQQRAAAHEPRRRRGDRRLLRGLLRRRRPVPGPALARAAPGERGGAAVREPARGVARGALVVVGVVSLLVVAVLAAGRAAARLRHLRRRSSRGSRACRVAALESLLLALTALVVVVGVKTVGVVLIAAFVVIPAATAQPPRPHARRDAAARGRREPRGNRLRPVRLVPPERGAGRHDRADAGRLRSSWRWCCGGGDGRGPRDGGPRAARALLGRSASSLAPLALPLPARAATRGSWRCGRTG